MLVNALSKHPDIPAIRHEFKGTEEEFWESPAVLSNTLEPWMLDDRIKRIHVGRNDYIEGAISLILMAYIFPNRSYVIPEHEVLNTARFRKEKEEEMRRVSHYSLAYEDLTGGESITELPEWFVYWFCKLIEVVPMPLPVETKKRKKGLPSNYEELKWLSV
jgi:hypothetical protein